MGPGARGGSSSHRKKLTGKREKHRVMTYEKIRQPKGDPRSSRNFAGRGKEFSVKRRKSHVALEPPGMPERKFDDRERKFSAAVEREGASGGREAGSRSRSAEKERPSRVRVKEARLYGERW